MSKELSLEEIEKAFFEEIIVDADTDTALAAPSRKFDEGPSIKFDVGPSRKFDSSAKSSASLSYDSLIDDITVNVNRTGCIKLANGLQVDYDEAAQTVKVSKEK